MSSYSNSLKTNKPTYVSGETLLIIGNIIGQSTTRIFNIHIYDPSGQLFKSIFVPVTKGSFSCSIKLNSSDPSGEYKIVTNPEDNDYKMECKILFYAENFGDTRIIMPIIRKLKNFEPLNVSSRNNKTVSWVNDDFEFHTATSFSIIDGNPDGVFDTGLVPPGKNSTLTIDNTNNQNICYYFCKLHPTERASVLLDGIINEINFQEFPKFEYIHRNIAEQTKKKLDVLLRHFEPSIIDMIDYDEISVVKNRLLTIVFWDIEGFSKLARSLEVYPELLEEYLKEYSDIAIKLVNKYGGYLDKFIGDGVMAIFGLQHKDEDGSHPAKNAVAAAIEFRNLFRELKDKWIDRWKKSVLKFEASQLALKCGIHTGLASFGNFGNDNLDQLTAVGHTVNFASRLCEFREKGGHIIVSSTTKSNIESMFEVISIGEQEVRSMGQHELFEVIKLYEAKEIFVPFELGKGKIVEWNIPTRVEHNRAAKVYAKFTGSVSSGFLDVAIYDSNNKDNWFADPSSYDCNLDTGKLNFKDKEYSNEWEFSVTSGLKEGKCRAVIGMYEDTNRLPFKSRRIVAIDEKEILLSSATIDPLLGKPDKEEEGIRFYVTRDDLPKIPKIFLLADLKSVSILSITSVILVLNYGTQIRNALIRGVSFNFLILDPEDSESVESQKRNYGGKNIKAQIRDVILELCKIRNELRHGLKKNLSIRLYRDINIEEGIMIIRRNNDSNSWLKVEDIIVGKDSNSRSSRSVFYHSNAEFFKQYDHKYHLIWDNKTTKEF